MLSDNILDILNKILKSVSLFVLHLNVTLGRSLIMAYTGDSHIPLDSTGLEHESTYLSYLSSGCFEPNTGECKLLYVIDRVLSSTEQRKSPPLSGSGFAVC
jgi:hypothetical protein